MYNCHTNIVSQKDTAYSLKTAGVNAEGSYFASELQNAVFEATGPTLLRAPDMAYAERELDWYLSLDDNVKSFPDGAPKIWNDTADIDGNVNSNYGTIVFREMLNRYSGESTEGGHSQFDSVVKALQEGRTRHAYLQYQTRDMALMALDNGMYDYTCTLYTRHWLEDDKHCMEVVMRSNDAVYGFPYDYLWQRFVQDKIANALNESGWARNRPYITAGKMIWNAHSLHVYPRHAELLK